MKDVTRQQLIETIQNEWGTYVKRFQSLSPQAQAAFLARQGYTRLGDLLAHIIAWWEVCQRAIPNYLADPAFSEQEYDLDTFNARAVQHFSGLDDPAIVQAFEVQRLAMLAFINRLPKAAFQNKKTADRLRMEFLGHLGEHALPPR